MPTNLIRNIKIVACGTSFHAGLVAKFWLENYAKITVDVEIASEFRYRTAIIKHRTLFIAISQSGETADTLAALRQAKKLGYFSTLAICNIANSSLAREAGLIFLTEVGVEIGVASTKAFTGQLIALLLLTVALAKSQKKMNIKQERKLLLSLKKIPDQIEKVLQLDIKIKRLSQKFTTKCQRK